jgi:hypothetical protein
MGSTGTYRPPGMTDRKFFETEFPNTLGTYGRIVACATKGTSGGEWNSVFYAAVRNKDNAPHDPGKTWALVVLKHGSGHNFVYKDLSEEMGPAEDECPANILSLLSPTDSQWANEWRERCYKRLAAIAARPRVTRGDVVTFAEPIQFTSGRTMPTLKFLSHSTFTDEDGRRYRVTGWRDLRYALGTEPPPPIQTSPPAAPPTTEGTDPMDFFDEVATLTVVDDPDTSPDSHPDTDPDNTDAPAEDDDKVAAILAEVEAGKQRTPHDDPDTSDRITGREGRTIETRWVLRENADGSTAVAMLVTHHFSAPTKAYVSSIRTVTDNAHDLGNSTTYDIMDNTRVGSEPAGRFSERGLRVAHGLALKALRAIAKSDKSETVLRYFDPERAPK